MTETLPGLRLDQLLSHLNQRYRVNLAVWFVREPWWTLIVERGTSQADVAVVASLDPDTETFRLAVFTAIEFHTSDDPIPFAQAERDSVERAARWIFNYIPETPTT